MTNKYDSAELTSYSDQVCAYIILILEQTRKFVITLYMLIMQ